MILDRDKSGVTCFKYNDLAAAKRRERTGEGLETGRSNRKPFQWERMEGNKHLWGTYHVARLTVLLSTVDPIG